MKIAAINLTPEPEMVTWPETHYVFVELIGPFLVTASKAWRNFHSLVPEVLKHNKITGYTSFYKLKPEMAYRAGASVASIPSEMPAGVRYEKFAGGRYARFYLTGPYSDLPEACGRVFEIVAEKELPMRDDYCIENYLNDPEITPKEQLVTQILIPIA